MTTMTERDVTAIAPLDHDAAMRLAATEYERVGALLRSLEPSDWTRATECEGWDVHAMASHIVGMVESLASPREFISLGYRAWRRPEVYVDGMTAVQVDDRRSCPPAELIGALRPGGPQGDAHPQAPAEAATGASAALRVCVRRRQVECCLPARRDTHA